MSLKLSAHRVFGKSRLWPMSWSSSAYLERLGRYSALVWWLRLGTWRTYMVVLQHRMSFRQLRAEIDVHDFYHDTVEGWFQFLSDRGWSGKEFRLTVNLKRRMRRRNDYILLRPCVSCGKHHDDLSTAMACPNWGQTDKLKET